MDKLTQIKATIIYDNNLVMPGLQYGFGFSCLLEYDNKKIIFDTGGNKLALFYNIQKLNIHLNTISHIIFSHQHWDHTAGFVEVIDRLSSNCKIYVPFKFDSKLLSQISKERQVNLMKGITRIEDDLSLVVLKGTSCVIKECFSVYEQSLVINRAKGAIVLTGCGHPGIKNILKTVHNELTNNIDWVIGGFHLHRSFTRTIDAIVNEFNLLGVQNVAPCDCTGQKAVLMFKNKFINKTHEVGTGTIFYI
jgi:7,8-dihydropterin-6-yl-methyl-4-(beta-D-ribofuranosyl)aminobenzene 5'-phosphate synthase